MTTQSHPHLKSPDAGRQIWVPELASLCGYMETGFQQLLKEEATKRLPTPGRLLPEDGKFTDMEALRWATPDVLAGKAEYIPQDFALYLVEQGVISPRHVKPTVLSLTEAQQQEVIDRLHSGNELSPDTKVALDTQTRHEKSLVRAGLAESLNR